MYVLLQMFSVWWNKGSGQHYWEHFAMCTRFPVLSYNRSLSGRLFRRTFYNQYIPGKPCTICITYLIHLYCFPAFWRLNYRLRESLLLLSLLCMAICIRPFILQNFSMFTLLIRVWFPQNNLIFAKRPFWKTYMH